MSSRSVPARAIPKVRKPPLVQRPVVSQADRDREAAEMLAREVEKMRFINSVRSGCIPVYPDSISRRGRTIPARTRTVKLEPAVGGGCSMRMNKKTGKRHLGHSNKPVFRSMGQLRSIKISH